MLLFANLLLDVPGVVPDVTRRPRRLHPIRDGVAPALSARAGGRPVLQRPAGAVLGVSAPPAPLFAPIVFTPLPLPERAPLPARESTPGVAPAPLRAVTRARALKVVPAAGVGASAGRLCARARGRAEDTAPRSGAECKHLLTSAGARAGAPAPRGIENPSDEEIIFMLLQARAKKKLTRKTTLW